MRRLLPAFSLAMVIGGLLIFDRECYEFAKTGLKAGCAFSLVALGLLGLIAYFLDKEIEP